MPEHDYDEHYANLGLKPGASLDKIQASWKEQAMLMHPDNFNPGPMKVAAEKRLILLNTARDALREYWQKNNAPPPSKLREAPTASAATNTTQTPPQPEKTWQQDAYQQWKKERQQQTAAEERARKQAKATGNTNTPPPHTPPPSKPRPPFGPPPAKKKPQYEFYDFLNATEDTKNIGAVIGAVVLFGTSFIGPAVVLITLGRLIGIPPSFWMNESLGGFFLLAAMAAVGVPCGRTFLADYELYEIENNPYLKPASLRAQDVINKITKTLVTPGAFDGQTWTLKDSQYNTETETHANNYVCKFPNCEAELNTRVMSASPTSSMVTYWFTIKNLPLWRTPVAKVLRKTDTALWKALK